MTPLPDTPEGADLSDTQPTGRIKPFSKTHLHNDAYGVMHKLNEVITVVNDLVATDSEATTNLSNPQGTPTGLDLDEILSRFESKVASDVADAIKGRPGLRTFGVDDNPKAEAKQALTRWGLEQRIDERVHTAVVKFKQPDGNWYEGIGYEIVGEVKPGERDVFTGEERIAELQANLQDGGEDGDSN